MSFVRGTGSGRGRGRAGRVSFGRGYGLAEELRSDPAVDRRECLKNRISGYKTYLPAAASRLINRDRLAGDFLIHASGPFRSRRSRRFDRPWGR